MFGNHHFRINSAELWVTPNLQQGTICICVQMTCCHVDIDEKTFLTYSCLLQKKMFGQINVCLRLWKFTRKWVLLWIAISLNHRWESLPESLNWNCPEFTLLQVKYYLLISSPRYPQVHHSNFVPPSKWRYQSCSKFQQSPDTSPLACEWAEGESNMTFSEMWQQRVTRVPSDKSAKWFSPHACSFLNDTQTMNQMVARGPDNMSAVQ